jgi:hypothetical protein
VNPLARAALPLLGAAAAIVAVACSKSSEPEELDDPDVQGDTTAPDGTPYPTTNIGSRPRAGTLPGNTFPNLTFHGYEASNVAGGLQVVSMADYFDPKGKDHVLVHLTAAATWCTVCAFETDNMQAHVDEARKEGAVEIAIMVAGQTAYFGPSLNEMDGWIDDHHTTFDVLVDLRGHRLKTAMGVDLVPWNALIDARTMEILRIDTGAPDDELGYLRLGLNWIAQHPL